MSKNLKRELLWVITALNCDSLLKSKGKGKSGGARVIIYVVADNNEVYLLTIYDKSELSSIDDKTIKLIIESLISDE